MKKLLVVVDMQNDFIDGALGSAQAAAIVPKVVRKVESFKGFVLFTRDTHHSDYLKTQEGRKLPVEHCIQGRPGWEICSALQPYVKNTINKPGFGCMALPDYVRRHCGAVDEIELVGLCTDICVIANAVILKTAFPEAEIRVDSSCCAGVSPQSHENALNAMRAIQINVI